jgi:hypothetical protein
LFVVGYRPDLVAAEKHPPSDLPGSAQRFKGENECPHWILPGLGVFVLTLDTTCWIPLPAGRESTGKQMNEAAASLVRIMEGYESYRRGESLSLSIFIQIFLGNIILRYLMRANLLLVIVTSVFYARHCVGLERVSFLDQLGHTLRIRTFDVGQSL